MTRYLHLLLIAAIITGLAGCNDQKHYRLGVSQCSDDDWRAKMNAEIERELLFHPETEVEIRSADDNSEKQIADLRYFIDNGFDAILVAPNEAFALTPIISEAYHRGIPVVVFDRKIIGESYTAWQGADNEAIGRAAAEHIFKNVGKDAKIIEIQGLQSSTPTIERHNGFKEIAGNRVLATAYGNWVYDDAYRTVDSLLKKYPNVDVIYAHNDRMAIAAADVAREHGVSPYIIGIDGAPSIGMKAVAEDVIDATFIYPTEGQKLVQTAMAIIEGEPYERDAILPGAGAITSSNVDALLIQNEEVKNETSRMELLKKELNAYWEQHTSQTAMLYAVIIIMVLLFGLLFLILRTFWQHRRHQAALERATASKLVFFTNVSHDLRTPLTLIAEPVEQMVNAENITDRQRALMKIADKNVKILKRLINQILDFRKFENNKLVLHLEQADFDVLIKDWTEAFAGLAVQRGIKFNVDIQAEKSYSTAVDAEKMERVFYNIVSNAFKYTPAGGEISIALHRSGNELIFSVDDTGKGISEEDLPIVFERFFQADRVVPGGSGIGLALAKAFVELHGGTIKAESKLGEGTTFTVKLPIKNVETKLSTDSIRRITSEIIEAEHSDALEKVNPEPTISADRPTVLVVDDNADIRVLLSDLLSDTYTIVTAVDGADGLKKAIKYVPDLVICDVMMPVMDGRECCRRLKSDIATSHIPVLMLTACAMDEQRIEGYEVGADGYVSKPFNASVMKSRVKNLINNRKLIRDLWQNQGARGENTPEPEPTEKRADADAPDIDNEFYKKFLRLVEEQMGNPDLNVEELASEMGLGRSQFYRKIKSLTNYSPVELLRRLRLSRANHLLKTSEKTISEISYEVGFSTPAYFTKCYRDTFGITPSEART